MQDVIVFELISVVENWILFIVIHLLFSVSVIIFSLIIDNWLSNLSFSKIIPSQMFSQ